MVVKAGGHVWYADNYIIDDKIYTYVLNVTFDGSRNIEINVRGQTTLMLLNFINVLKCIIERFDQITDIKQCSYDINSLNNNSSAKKCLFSDEQ